MGNGQSSPSSHHSHREHKPSSSHHHHSRSSSPHAPNSNNSRRKKSLELPDLANLALTSVNSTPGSGLPSPIDTVKSVLKTGSRPAPGLIKTDGNHRRRFSPLAPTLVTSPLSPISPKSTSINAVHNPYFPSNASPSTRNHVSATIDPVPIPKTPQTPNAGLPDYSRSYTPSKVPSPASHVSPSTTDVPQLSKKARISDSVPEAHSPPASSRASYRQHTKKEPSLGGGEDETYIRSSLPLGGAASSPGPHVDGTEVVPPSFKSAISDLAASVLVDGPLENNQSVQLEGTTKAEENEKEILVEAKEEGVPTIINWTGGGKEVFVCGTFAKNWKERIRMNKSTHDFTLVLNLPPGPHRLKFIVDESWKCSDDLATATDADGSLVNYIEVEPETTREDGKGWSSDWEGVVEDNDDDPDQWTTEIPELLLQTQAAEEAHLTYISNLAPANRQPGSAALANPPGLPYPPGLPRHLEKVILNNPPKDGGQGGAGASAGTTEGNVVREPERKRGGNSAIAACWTARPDDNSILPIPNHVVLNHLTASAIRNGTLAVGTTTRYKRKYISTLLYKPVEIRD